MTEPFDFKQGIFLEIPQIDVLPNAHDGHALLVTRDRFVWRDHKRVIWINPGLVFDGASVPNAVYPLIDANALDLIRCGHDAPYRTDFTYIDLRAMDARYTAIGMGTISILDDIYTPDRHECDKMLSKMCQNVGVDWDDCKKIYYGVRVGGGSSYHQRSMNWMEELR